VVTGVVYRKSLGLLLLLIMVTTLLFSALPAVLPESACRLTGQVVLAHRYEKYRHCRQCTVKCRTNIFTGHETCRTVCRTRHCGLND